MNKDRPKIIVGNAWAKQVCAALGIEVNYVRRIVVDSLAGDPLRVYIEYLGDERLLSVAFPGPDGVEIKRD